MGSFCCVSRDGETGGLDRRKRYPDAAIWGHEFVWFFWISSSVLALACSQRLVTPCEPHDVEKSRTAKPIHGLWRHLKNGRLPMFVLIMRGSLPAASCKPIFLLVWSILSVCQGMTFFVGSPKRKSYGCSQDVPCRDFGCNKFSASPRRDQSVLPALTWANYAWQTMPWGLWRYINSICCEMAISEISWGKPLSCPSEFSEERQILQFFGTF